MRFEWGLQPESQPWLKFSGGLASRYPDNPLTEKLVGAMLYNLFLLQNFAVPRKDFFDEILSVSLSHLVNDFLYVIVAIWPVVWIDKIVVEHLDERDIFPFLGRVVENAVVYQLTYTAAKSLIGFIAYYSTHSFHGNRHPLNCKDKNNLLWLRFCIMEQEAHYNKNLNTCNRRLK